ncbi:hypothetical protein B0920_03165 [Massilia sp. KIM]|uniref:nuclear transport factor 2 family protein n=1 Tax=Massilia sp. KIM TaxID=1955422 RepID=UPI00098EBEDD|nr:nuclear transport factor 2 family protein [Massilia sp. KIM]OON62473.1 hypothetical protein B0920_03165 [Massilia sp. KIM]
MHTSNLFQSSAATVMVKHIELIGTDLNAWLQLLAHDAVVEFPYGASLGRSTRYENRADIEAHMRSFTGIVGSFKFSDIDITESADGLRAWASFRGEAWVESRRTMYRQDYAAYLVLQDGKIKLYREYWNPCHIAAAFGAKLHLEEPD